jgi:hypothetical protein
MISISHWGMFYIYDLNSRYACWEYVWKFTDPEIAMEAIRWSNSR